MDPDVDPTDELHGEPRVSCEDCGFRWFGPTAVHGLSVIGHCPRCGGTLAFHEQLAVVGVARREQELEDIDERASDLQPWQVLGMPTSWAH
jgi:hypothetical protein